MSGALLKYGLREWLGIAKGSILEREIVFRSQKEILGYGGEKGRRGKTEKKMF